MSGRPSSPTVLIVPGLRDHVADHWQTLYAARTPGACSVPPGGRENLDCSAPCTRRRVHGALLAAPPDFERPLPSGYPTLAALSGGGWLPVPRDPLPFPSIVAASRNDPLATFDRVAELAACWGSRLVDLGEVGHLNPASGFGEWPDAGRLVAQLVMEQSNGAAETASEPAKEAV